MGSRNRWVRTRVERGIYLLPNGKYAVCCRRRGRRWYRTVGSDLAGARVQRQALVAPAEDGLAHVSPRLLLRTVAGWWLVRFEAKVTASDRRVRTLEAHRYDLSRHILPALGGVRIAALTGDDVAAWLDGLRRKGCSSKTAAGALATLHSIVRYARRHGWITIDPVDQLEADERPRPARRRQRVLGREDIGRLLAACTPRDRMIVATALYTGLRISELLGLTWSDVDFDRGCSPRPRAALALAPRRASSTRRAKDARVSPRRPTRRPARPNACGSQGVLEPSADSDPSGAYPGHTRRNIRWGTRCERPRLAESSGSQLRRIGGCDEHDRNCKPR